MTGTKENIVLKPNLHDKKKEVNSITMNWLYLECHKDISKDIYKKVHKKFNNNNEKIRNIFFSYSKKNYNRYDNKQKTITNLCNKLKIMKLYPSVYSLYIRLSLYINTFVKVLYYTYYRAYNIIDTDIDSYLLVKA